MNCIRFKSILNLNRSYTVNQRFYHMVLSYDHMTYCVCGIVERINNAVVVVVVVVVGIYRDGGAVGNSYHINN